MQWISSSSDPSILIHCDATGTEGFNDHICRGKKLSFSAGCHQWPPSLSLWLPLIHLVTTTSCVDLQYLEMYIINCSRLVRLCLVRCLALVFIKFPRLCSNHCNMPTSMLHQHLVNRWLVICLTVCKYYRPSPAIAIKAIESVKVTCQTFHSFILLLYPLHAHQLIRSSHVSRWCVALLCCTNPLVIELSISSL